MNLDLLKYFLVIKDNFDNIKNIETFTVDSAFTYKADDLSLTENARKEYNARWPVSQKDAKENPKFPATLSSNDNSTVTNDNCETDLFDTRCNTGLKTAVWIVISFAILFVILFIWYIIKAIYMSTTSQSPVLQEPQIIQPVIQEQTKENSPSFWNRLIGQKQEEYKTDTTEINRDISSKTIQPAVETEDNNFMERLIGNKPLPNKKEKIGFAKRFFGSAIRKHYVK